MKKNDVSKKDFYYKRSIRIIVKRRIRKNKKRSLVLPKIDSKSESHDEYIEAWAPSNLTLKYENCEKVLRFIKKIKQIGSKGYNIDLRLEKVNEIGEGAISMLLSVISDLESKGLRFRGNKPINDEAKNILEASGFFSHMRGYVSNKNRASKNKILKTGNVDTHQKEIVPEIHKAMETIWKVEGRCPDLYSGLGEMLRNTCDHAFYDKKNIKWHLGISHFEAENCVKFSFVDNGAGILNTYQEKGVLNIIKSYFKDNADILNSAFNDGIKSRTGLSWRGKGLPTIFEMYKENIITNFVVITNNVYLDFDRGLTKQLPIEFDGTYYFWVINDKCEPAFFKI